MLLLMITVQTTAQEMNLPVFSQYLADSEFVVSPTFAGIGDNLRVRLNALTQWVGIKNAPDNQAFYADLRFSRQSGLGLSLYNDRNGNTIQKGAKISFAHHITMDYRTEQYLSFGISANTNSFRLDIENFRPTANMPIVDPFVTDDRSESNINFDVGILYRNRDAYFSLNANNILPKDIDQFSGLEPNLLINFQLYAGYTYRMNRYAQLEPSMFYQHYASDGRSSTDISLKYRKYNRDNDFYWIGGTYRFLNDQLGNPIGISPMVGLQKSIFYVSYAYQVTTNELITLNSGTHSLTIGVNLLQGVSNCPCTATKRPLSHIY